MTTRHWPYSVRTLPNGRHQVIRLRHMQTRPVPVGKPAKSRAHAQAEADLLNIKDLAVGLVGSRDERMVDAARVYFESMGR